MAFFVVKLSADSLESYNSGEPLSYQIKSIIHCTQDMARLYGIER